MGHLSKDPFSLPQKTRNTSESITIDILAKREGLSRAKADRCR